MKIISANIAQPTTIIWKGKEAQTGIYKYPIKYSIFLGKHDVIGDAVMDRKNHGGIDMACYLYSADHYDYWKKLYPNLDWNWGMFGENLTIEGLNEAKIRIGNIYKIGEAVIQIVQPRIPCFKLGVRFDNQKIVKQFLNASYPGIYVRVIQEGKVSENDQLVLLEESTQNLTVTQVYSLYSSNKNNNSLAKNALNSDALANGFKSSIKKRFPLVEHN